MVCMFDHASESPAHRFSFWVLGLQPRAVYMLSSVLALSCVLNPGT